MWLKQHELHDKPPIHVDGLSIYVDGLWLAMQARAKRSVLCPSWLAVHRLDRRTDGLFWTTRNHQTNPSQLRTGWWLGHPSEKYESQLGYMGK